MQTFGGETVVSMQYSFECLQEKTNCANFCRDFRGIEQYSFECLQEIHKNANFRREGGGERNLERFCKESGGCVFIGKECLKRLEMKKTRLLFVMLLAAVGLMVNSCIMDWVPVQIKVYVTDSNGTDLLDPSYEKNLLDGVTMTYRGDVYQLTATTKYYMPTFYGFELYTDKDGKNYLYFGELDGADEYDDDFIITWKDGTQDIIHYKRNIAFTNAYEKMFLNGKKVAKDDAPITIVK